MEEIFPGEWLTMLINLFEWEDGEKLEGWIPLNCMIHPLLLEEKFVKFMKTSKNQMKG